MYESVKEFCNISVKYIPQSNEDEYGDRTPSSPVDMLVYVEEKMSKIVDKYGTEVISHTILYLEGNSDLNADGKFLFNGVTSPIKRLTGFFREGKRDLWVVYL